MNRSYIASNWILVKARRSDGAWYEISKRCVLVLLKFASLLVSLRMAVSFIVICAYPLWQSWQRSQQIADFAQQITDLRLKTAQQQQILSSLQKRERAFKF